jgi:SdrD B-like domain
MQGKSARARRGQLFEVLEGRQLMSASAAHKLHTPASDRHVKGSTTGQAYTNYLTLDSGAAATTTNPLAGSTTPYGKTPAQIRKAYGLDNIKFGAITGDGAGQTIAIVDAYDDPSFVSSTAANFASSDLHRFDQQFGLADPPSFTKVSQTGTSSYPAYNSGWAGEIALDVEWAHAMAPQANIILVEAKSASLTDLNTAVNWAKKQPGVSAISMSYGTDEYSSETSNDSTFTTPSGHAGVTFLSSTGDSGSPGGYQAFSPNVVAVGGTSLSIADSSGTYSSESAWSGSGGGVSLYESKPSYQNLITTNSATKRTIPDLSAVADPNTGVAVLDTSAGGIGSTASWLQYGGTSLSSPLWAGMIAVANQGRAALGLSSLDSFSQTLPRLYTLSSSDFHDVTSGSNGGFSATSGYDAVTGRGSPLGASLIPDLAGGITISGTVYQDADGDQSRDAGETGMSGVKIYLDLNNNGTLETVEPTATTSSSGAYTFSDVIGRSYNVRQALPIGQIASSPAALTLSTSYGQSYTADFGDFASSATSQSFTGSGLTLRMDPTGQQVQVYNNGNANYSSAPLATLSPRLVTSIALNGTAGDDMLTLDLSNGNPLTGVAVTYNGAAQASSAGDAINVVGSSSAAENVGFSDTVIAVAGSSLTTSNVESLNFNGNGGLDVVTDTASQLLTLAGDQQLASLSATGGVTSVTLSSGNHALYTQSLNLASGAKLDLTDGSMAIDDASSFTTVQSALGNGVIVTSAATGGLTTLGYARASEILGAGGGTFAGHSVAADGTLVKFTYAGDANFDGKINVDDYGRIDFNVTIAGTSGWFNGDFNRDGKINVDDYGIIDFNVGIQGPVL